MKKFACILLILILTFSFLHISVAETLLGQPCPTHASGHRCYDTDSYYFDLTDTTHSQYVKNTIFVILVML